MGTLTQGKFTLGTKTKAQISALIAPTSLTGTASITTGTSTVTGVGTLFTQQLIIGDVIRLSSSSFIIQSITNDTTLITTTTNAASTISGVTPNLANPRRIKNGASVYNITDRFPMYYSGDNAGFISLTKWKLGGFANGQVVPIRCASITSGTTEGKILYADPTADSSVFDYTPSPGTLDLAVGVGYFTTLGDACNPTAVSGIHNTDVSVTTSIVKASFLKPASSGANGVIYDGTGTAESCGIACTNPGTPVAGEIEMLVNFIERL